MEEKTIIALEIGSSKIKGAIGTVDSSGLLSVKAVEEEKISDIVRYGCIRNVVETATATRNVINRLEQREAPRKIERVYVSLGGRSLTSESITIERRYATETEITRNIIIDMTEEAMKRPLNDRTVVKALPREFRVDGAPTSHPVGMLGQDITANLNLLSCRSQLLKNLMQVIDTRLGLKIADIVARPLAEADLVLMSDEKRLGCMMVDFGAETTTVVIYKGGVLMHLAVLPMGSRNITRDITSLNFLEEKAEELKITFGSALPSAEMPALRPAENIDITAVNNYVSARATEILLNIEEQIKVAGLTPAQLPAGVVVVGRGSKLNGLCSRLEQILPGMRVRVGAPDSKVRILDGRIQSSDAVDVIAILEDAARNGAVECLSPQPVVTAQTYAAPEPQQPVQQPVQQPAQQPVQQPAQQPAQQAAPGYQYPHRGNNRPIEAGYANQANPANQAQNINRQPERRADAAQTQGGGAPAHDRRRRGSAFSQWMENVKNEVAERVADIFTEKVDDDEE